MGLPLALRAVEVGYHVVGFDLDAERIKLLAAGSSYIGDIPDDRLARALDSGRFEPTDDPDRLAGFDIAVIDVPTPLHDGVPNLSFVEDAAAAVARHLGAGALVVLESTSYPGTTEELVAPILEEGSGLLAGTDFHLGYSPERIDPGNRTWRLENTPKVVSGVDEASLQAVRGFYDRIVERTVPVSGTREAELTKLLENTFRHVNIALVNELAMFAADLDIDVWEAIDAASTKPFGYLRFTPGPGVGGHCLPDRPELPVVEGAQQPRPAVPLRRAGQRRQRAHARLRGAPPDPGPQPHGPGRQRLPVPAARSGLQAEHRGRPRGARDDHRQVAGRDGRRGPGGRSPRRRPRTCRARSSS